MTADEYFGGKTKGPILINLEKGFVPAIREFNSTVQEEEVQEKLPSNEKELLIRNSVSLVSFQFNCQYPSNTNFRMSLAHVMVFPLFLILLNSLTNGVFINTALRSIPLINTRTIIPKFTANPLISCTNATVPRLIVAVRGPVTDISLLHIFCAVGCPIKVVVVLAVVVNSIDVAPFFDCNDVDVISENSNCVVVPTTLVVITTFVVDLATVVVILVFGNNAALYSSFLLHPVIPEMLGFPKSGLLSK